MANEIYDGFGVSVYVLTYVMGKQCRFGVRDLGLCTRPSEVWQFRVLSRGKP